MADVLIVEDSNAKALAIRAAVAEVAIENSVDLASSYKDAVKKIKTNAFKVIILDMTMPVFSKGNGQNSSQLRALAGRDIMAKMKYYDINIPVVVITQFDIFGRHGDVLEVGDLSNQLFNEYSDFYRGCVYYDEKNDLWKKKLKGLLEMIFDV